MATHRLIVFTEPTPGKEAEYNEWYDQVHLKEVLETGGFVAAQRFVLSDTQMGDFAEAAPKRYMAIYEIETDDLAGALEKLNTSSDTMNLSDAIDLEGAQAFAYTAVGERKSTV